MTTTITKQSLAAVLYSELGHTSERNIVELTSVFDRVATRLNAPAPRTAETPVPLAADEILAVLQTLDLPLDCATDGGH